MLATGGSCQLVSVQLVTSLSLALELVFPSALLCTVPYFNSLGLKLLWEPAGSLAKPDDSNVLCSLLSQKVVRLLKRNWHLANPGWPQVTFLFFRCLDVLSRRSCPMVGLSTGCADWAYSSSGSPPLGLENGLVVSSSRLEPSPSGRDLSELLWVLG